MSGGGWNTAPAGAGGETRERSPSGCTRPAYKQTNTLNPHGNKGDRNDRAKVEFGELQMLRTNVGALK